MKINRSIGIAVGIAVVFVGWFTVGSVFGRETTSFEDATPPPAKPQVQAIVSQAAPYRPNVTLRGRTQAVRAVDVRAESFGVVEALPFERGDEVVEGDVLCQLSLEAREAETSEARALVEQRRLEYDAALDLKERGVRSTTQVAAAKASYDAAKAMMRRAEVELARTRIRAPFDGVLDRRPVEIGDYLRAGDICGAVVDLDPILAIGQASEQDVIGLRTGQTASVALATGEHLEGRLRYISSETEDATRTFRIEIETPNPDRTLRSGVSATITITTEPVPAHRVTPAALTLDDQGRLTVRLVEDAIIRLVPVTVVEDAEDGVWVAGLPERAEIMLVGDTAVREGEEVVVTYIETPGA